MVYDDGYRLTPPFTVMADLASIAVSLLNKIVPDFPTGCAVFNFLITLIFLLTLIRTINGIYSMFFAIFTKRIIFFHANLEPCPRFELGTSSLQERRSGQLS